MKLTLNKKKYQLGSSDEDEDKNAMIGQTIGNVGSVAGGIISQGYKADYGKTGNAISAGVDVGINAISAFNPVAGGVLKLGKGIFDGITGNQQRKTEEAKQKMIEQSMRERDSIAKGRANANPNAYGNRLTTIYQLGKDNTNVSKKELYLPKNYTKPQAQLKAMDTTRANRMTNERNDKALMNEVGELGLTTIKAFDPTTLSNAKDTYDVMTNPKATNFEKIAQATYHIPFANKTMQAIQSARTLGGYAIDKASNYLGLDKKAMGGWIDYDRERASKKPYQYQLGGLQEEMMPQQGGEAIPLNSSGDVLYQGNQHSEGGIKLPNAEVENGEVAINTPEGTIVKSDILIDPMDEQKRTFAEIAQENSMKKGMYEKKLLKLQDKIGKKEFISSEDNGSIKVIENAIQSIDTIQQEAAERQEQIKQETMQVDANSPEAQVGLRNGGQRMEFNNVQAGQEFTGEGMQSPTLMQLGTQEDGYVDIKDTRIMNPGETMTVPNGVNKVIEQKMALGGKLQTGNNMEMVKGYGKFLRQTKRQELRLAGDRSERKNIRDKYSILNTYRPDKSGMSNEDYANLQTKLGMMTTKDSMSNANQVDSIDNDIKYQLGSKMKYQTGKPKYQTAGFSKKYSDAHSNLSFDEFKKYKDYSNANLSKDFDKYFEGKYKQQPYIVDNSGEGKSHPKYQEEWDFFYEKYLEDYIANGYPVVNTPVQNTPTINPPVEESSAEALVVDNSLKLNPVKNQPITTTPVEVNQNTNQPVVNNPVNTVTTPTINNPNVGNTTNVPNTNTTTAPGDDFENFMYDLKERGKSITDPNERAKFYNTEIQKSGKYKDYSTWNKQAVDYSSANKRLDGKNYTNAGTANQGWNSFQDKSRTFVDEFERPVNTTPQVQEAGVKEEPLLVDGRSNVAPLTPKGFTQPNNIGQQLKDKYPKFDNVNPNAYKTTETQPMTGKTKGNGLLNLAANADIITGAFNLGRDKKPPYKDTTGYINPALEQYNTTPINDAYRSTRRALQNNNAQNQNLQLMNLASKQSKDLMSEIGGVNNRNIDRRNNAQAQNIGIEAGNNQTMYDNQANQVKFKNDRNAKLQQLASQVSGRAQSMIRDNNANNLANKQLDLYNNYFNGTTPTSTTETKPTLGNQISTGINNFGKDLKQATNDSIDKVKGMVNTGINNRNQNYVNKNMINNQIPNIQVPQININNPNVGLENRTDPYAVKGNVNEYGVPNNWLNQKGGKLQKGSKLLKLGSLC